MSTPDNAARLREIQRLHDRLQQLPHIAGTPGNGLPNRPSRHSIAGYIMQHYANP